jgi:anthranilate/para-aminobenzoate synthase component I
MNSPGKKEFLNIIRESGIPPVYREIPYSEPYHVYESFASPNSFLFESVKGPAHIARYSYIGFDPSLSVLVKNRSVEILTHQEKFISDDHPLKILRRLIHHYKQHPVDLMPPFQGGFAGILNYDFVHYLETLPSTTIDDLALPDAHFNLIDKLIVFDHLSCRSWILVCPGVRDTMGAIDTNRNIVWTEKYDEAEEEIEKIQTKIHTVSEKRNSIDQIGTDRKIEIRYEMKKKQYMDMVCKAKDYIAAGDIFQANLSQRVFAYIHKKSPWGLYKVLRHINPAPFAAYADFGGYQIVSSSPERLIKTRNGVIETRPIAGTRPRGRDRREDECMRNQLLLNEKERAEHIMLIDLERNDLGRVSEYRSIKVDEFMITEDYSHVIHIVSNISGRMAHGKDAFDAIRAVFPGGTITGVPKVRCMQIIDELEPVRRGPYTGSLGYIGFSGNMDLNIIIRTLVVKGSRAYVQSGAGIVADSDPEREYYETLKKAEALIKTLEVI